MDKLSLELVYLIVSHLAGRPPLPPAINLPYPPPRRESMVPYATISRQWQVAVENVNFTHIKVKSSDLAEFATVFSYPRRRALLRRLDLDVVLPSYCETRVADFETREEHRANVTAFDKGVRALLDLLRHWEEDTPGGFAGYGGDDFALRIEAHSPMDGKFGLHSVPVGIGRDRYAGRYLVFVEALAEGTSPAPLPTVRRVSHFLYENPERQFHPAALCQVLDALPNLETIDLDLGEPPFKALGRRREHRLALAAGLEKLELSRLTSLRINWSCNMDPFNHSFNCGDLTVDGVDALNEALRRLAQRCPLRELELKHALVSPELFVDHKAGLSPVGMDSATVWSNLQRFTITTGMVAPNGTWYYTGDLDAQSPGWDATDHDFDDTDDDEDADSRVSSDDDGELEQDRPSRRDDLLNGVRPAHEWRNRPDPSLFNPLVRAMALAATQAPNLKRLAFQMAMDLGDPIGVEFEFLAAGVPSMGSYGQSSESEHEVKVRRVRSLHGSMSEVLLEDDVNALLKEWVGEGGVVVHEIWRLGVAVYVQRR